MTQGPTRGDTRKDRMRKDPRGFLQLAEEHRKRGRHTEAIAVCLEGLALHPTLDAARVTLGRAYLEAGQMEAARDTLQEVFDRLPEHHLAGKLLAETRKRLGDLQGAAATCREILRSYPRDREVEALLAAVEQAAVPAEPPALDPAPDYLPEDVASPPLPSPSAVKAVDAATPARRDELQTNTLADLYLKQGLVDRALEVYRGMLRQDPGNEPVRLRIRELEQVGSPAAPPAAPAVAPPMHAAKAQAMEAAPVPEREAIARLERWLASIRAGSPMPGRSRATR